MLDQEQDQDRDSRRNFLKSVALASTLPAVVTTARGDNTFELARAGESLETKAFGPNDKVRIATIGMGIIGFIDTDTALKVPGVELVAAADLYEGRRVHAKEVYGDRISTHVDYREILAKPDVDAVLICVPDHWHSRISIDAMKAGKAVYCEKPMVQKVEEGPAVIAAEKETGAVFQVGSQYVSSLIYEKVRELIKGGAIGALNSIETRYNRNSSIGAWQYTLPTDASPADGRLGPVPRRGPQASVRSRPVLPLEELLRLRHGRGGRPVRPPAHRHPPCRRLDRAEPDRRDGGPAVLEGRPRRLRRHHGTDGLPRDRQASRPSRWRSSATSRTAAAATRCSGSWAPTA